MKTELMSAEDEVFFHNCTKCTLESYPMERPTAPNSTKLYHYCSMDSMHKILESNVLRAGNYKFMNDKGEGTYLSKFLSKVAEFDDNDFTLFDRYLANVFITSFSEKFDDLYQWKLYGDDGSGVAIGFRFDSFSDYDGYPIDLRDRAQVLKPRFGLNKVLYDKEEQKEAFRRFITGFKKLKESIRNPFQQSMFEKFFYRGYTMLASRCKDEAWKSESEWRNIGFYENANTDRWPPQFFDYTAISKDDQLKFKVTKDNRLAPFYDVPFNMQSDIAEIVIGPKSSRNFQDIKYSLEMFFITRGWNVPVIKVSSIELAF